MTSWTEPDWSRLTRWLAGDADASDRAVIEAWRDASPEHAAALAELAARWTVHTLAAPPVAGADAHWAALQARFASDETPPSRPVAPPRRTVHARRRVSRLAGMTAFALAACVAVAAVVLRFSAATPSQAARVYTTAAGERTVVTLADGSRITLAPRTTMTVPADFGRERRTLRLDGQAQFAVAHAAGAPFIVQTRRVSTRVLGTVFDVRQYADDPDVRIVVESGKVAAGWSADHAPVTLTAGMIARLTDSSATVVPPSDVSTLMSWTSGRLAFRDVPVPELLATVGRWYDLDFRLADSSVATRHVTTTLDGRTRDGVLRAISLLLNVRVTVDTTSVPRQPTVVILRPGTPDLVNPPRRRDGADPTSSSPELGR